VSVDRQQYKKVDCLTAVLLKVVGCDSVVVVTVTG